LLDLVFNNEFVIAYLMFLVMPDIYLKGMYIRFFV